MDSGERERERDLRTRKRQESGTENGGGRGCQEVNFTLSSRSWIYRRDGHITGRRWGKDELPPSRTNRFRLLTPRGRGHLPPPAPTSPPIGRSINYHRHPPTLGRGHSTRLPTNQRRRQGAATPTVPQSLDGSLPFCRSSVPFSKIRVIIAH